MKQFVVGAAILIVAGCGGSPSGETASGGVGSTPRVLDVEGSSVCSPAEVGDPTLDSDCEYKALPGTGAVYCITHNPACLEQGANCPLFLSSNFTSAFLHEATHPETFGNILVASVDTGPSHEFWPDIWAELPQVIGADYPGMDSDRVYAIGASLGTDRIGNMLDADADTSSYGKISELYAGLVFVAGCPPKYQAGAPKIPTLILGGTKDWINGPDGTCSDGARQLAESRGCSNSGAMWTNAASNDPWLPEGAGNGSDRAQLLTFGDCGEHDVVHYRFKDEEHVTGYGIHFDPDVDSTQIAWNFLQGRRRAGAGGVTGYSKGCR